MSRVPRLLEGTATRTPFHSQGRPIQAFLKTLHGHLQIISCYRCPCQLTRAYDILAGLASLAGQMRGYGG
jgi:hypothetical protein